MKKTPITPEKTFQPYNLTIETREEHDFLEGLFRAGDVIKKKDCRGYDFDIDHKFWTTIKKPCK